MIALIAIIKLITLHNNLFGLVIEVNENGNVLKLCIWTQECRKDGERTEIG